MDFAEQLRILQAAQGDTALLALATVDLAHSTLSEAERARINEALIACAVPHWCDRHFLAALLQTTAEEGDDQLGQLRVLTVVEPFPARGEHAVNVHETARLALREHLRTTDTDLWRTLSARARAHVAQSQEPHARIEALYHLFATDQATAAGECETLERKLTVGGRPEVSSALALALEELTSAGWLEGAAECEALLSQAEVRNSREETAQLEDEARRIVTLARAASHPSGVGRAKGLLGDVLQTKGCLDEALAEFRECLTIFQHLAESDPSNSGWQRELALAHHRLGQVFRNAGDEEKAQTSFRSAVGTMELAVAAAPGHVSWKKDLAKLKSWLS